MGDYHFGLIGLMAALGSVTPRPMSLGRRNCEVSDAGVGSRELGIARKRKNAEKARKKAQRRIVKRKMGH